MTASNTDPFRHHPNLRGKIADPETSFFRDFTTDKLRAILVEHDLPVDWWYGEAEREALRAEALDGRLDDDLWVFGYGSLMWDPAIHFSEVRRARIEGYQRRFILKDVAGGRGTEELPGLMAALDMGGACDGLVLRVDRSVVDRESEILWRREMLAPAYQAEFVEADTAHGPVQALIFAADHDTDWIDADISHAEQVRLFATASGFLGSSRDYLDGVAEKLELIGIHDEDVKRLLADVDAYQGCEGP